MLRSIQFIVLDSPFTNLHTMMIKIGSNNYGIKSFIVKIVLYFIAIMIKNNIMYDVINNNKPIDKVCLLNTNVLFVKGDNDDIINNFDF